MNFRDGFQAKFSGQMITARAIRTFVQKVDKKAGARGCWPWLGSRNSDGYGRAYIGSGVEVGAHRVAFALAKNQSICSSDVIRHSCDNPSCCNPKHLLLGGTLENIQDRQDRKRQARGESNGRAKLNPGQVLAIRESKLSTYELAANFGVHPKTVRDVISRKNWALL